MTPEQQMERFSFAYARAVGAAAGVNVTEPDVDEDSVDLVFSTRSVVGRPQSPMIEVQVKCTGGPPVKGKPEGQVIRHKLKVKNYNELVGQRYVPRYLVLVVVPDDPKDWLTQTEKALTLLRCGYWLSLANEPESTNETSVTVSVPRTKVFSVEALHQLLRVGGAT